VSVTLQFKTSNVGRPFGLKRSRGHLTEFQVSLNAARMRLAPATAGHVEFVALTTRAADRGNLGIAPSIVMTGLAGRRLITAGRPTQPWYSCRPASFGKVEVPAQRSGSPPGRRRIGPARWQRDVSRLSDAPPDEGIQRAFHLWRVRRAVPQQQPFDSFHADGFREVSRVNAGRIRIETAVQRAG
jgi:hypothetical protein